MTFKTLEAALMDFFGDTSRSAGQTKAGLLAISEEAQMLVETIEDAPDFEGDGVKS